MALADYYARTALAAAQVLSGFDESAFSERLSQTTVGIAIGSDAAGRPEGQAALDLAVRLLARLYPAIAIAAPAPVATHELARAINPYIDLIAPTEATVGIVIGDATERFPVTVFAGSDGWDALIDDQGPQPVGTTDNPLGAGASAALAAGNVFRAVFTDAPRLDRALRYSTYLAARGTTPDDVPHDGWSLPGTNVLVGGGALGHAASWALRRAPLDAHLAIVDHETLDLGNLQRYVLAVRADEDAEKAPLLEAAFDAQGTVRVTGYHGTLADYLGEHGRRADLMLLALDNAPDRRAAQASLPRRVINAWTQPADLGVSVHSDFGGDGACASCLYLPAGRVKNDDEIVAEGLGVPDHLMQVRTLLHTGAPVGPELAAAIAAGLGVDPARVAPFADRPIRDLWVKGVCGGDVLPLGAAGRPGDDVHVPLAHQSALAGILLAAAACRLATGDIPDITRVAQLDPMRAVNGRTADPARVRGDGRCICEDSDFRAAFAAAYPRS